MQAIPENGMKPSTQIKVVGPQIEMGAIQNRAATLAGTGRSIPDETKRDESAVA
jgi:hypothetical protein